MLQDFLIASGISAVLILMCAAFFYEILAHVWVRLPQLEGRPRTQILFTLFSAFIGHTVCIWIFGASYFALDQLAFGSLKGDITHHLMDYVYFSGVTYTSLGLGDVVPTGGLTLLVGVEALLGLILIGWSVTFTYLVTEKYLFHRRNPHR